MTVGASPGSEVPQALSLRVVFKGDAPRSAAIRRAGEALDFQPGFEISRRSDNALSYLLTFDQSKGRIAGVVAEIELDTRPGANIRIEVDPVLTLLSNQSGTRKATVAGGTLHVSGTAIDAEPSKTPKLIKE